jgi:hypothetical protein
MPNSEDSPEEDSDSPPTFYVDAREDPLFKAAQKQRTAISQFNYFLTTYCVQIGVEIVKADAIPYRGLYPIDPEEPVDHPRKVSQKTIFTFWNMMVGAFFSYGHIGDVLPNRKGRRLPSIRPNTARPSKYSSLQNSGMNRSIPVFDQVLED